MSSPRNPFDSKLTPVGSEKDAYFQIGVQLPKFYLRVLDGEGAYLGGMRRSQVLELLVLRKAGRLRIERSPHAPEYRAAPGELDDLDRYLWHSRREIKVILDRLRERMGGIPPRSWIILALNEWIGLPAGMGDLDDEAPTQITAVRNMPPPPPPQITQVTAVRKRPPPPPPPPPHRRTPK